MPKTQIIVFTTAIIIAIEFGLGLLIFPFVLAYHDQTVIYRSGMRDAASYSLMKTCIRHKMQMVAGVDLRTLKTPVYSSDDIARWVSKALPSIISYDHDNLDQQILSSEKYFTPSGWCDFINALAEANLVGPIKRNKFSLKVENSAVPIIIKSQANEDGIYTWYVQVPATLSFIKYSGKLSEDKILSKVKFVVEIERSSSETNPDGIGISQWNEMQGW